MDRIEWCIFITPLLTDAAASTKNQCGVIPPPINRFKQNRDSPSNKKVRNTMDSITCTRKSRRPRENSMHRSILTAVPLQQQAKNDQNRRSDGPQR